MRIFSTLLAGAVGLALAAGAPVSSQAQEGKSWGPKHTTYWSTPATGTHEPGKFMDQQQMTQPAGTQQPMQFAPQQRRAKAPMRVKQPQARVRQQQPTQRPGQPPAEAKPSAPPSGQEPAQGQQPMQKPGAPK